MIRLEIFVRDLDASLAFYTDVLGFTEAVDGATGTYRPLQRGLDRISLQDIATLSSDHPLMLSQSVGGGIELVLEVDDIEAFHEEVSRKWPIESELSTRPWGLTDFRLLDPDGYYWRPTNR